MKLKKITALLLGVCTMGLGLPLGGCTAGQSPKEDTLTIVTTVFATYDLSLQLAERLGIPYEVELLLTPGGESHAYEPTPADVAAIQSCDLFVYIGGASEQWAESLLESIGRTNENPTIGEKGNLRLMDCITPIETTHEEDEHSHEHEHEHSDDEATLAAYDEHIWTSPENACLMMHEIAHALYQAAPEAIDKLPGAESAVAKELEALMEEYAEAAKQTKGKTLVVADRFPFRYLTEAYDWNYYAAFSGCSSDTDVSAATLSNLITTVKEEGIDTIFYLENSPRKIADAVCEATGAKALCLQSLNNVSKEDFESGKHYQDYMRENLSAIKEALNGSDDTTAL